MQEICLWLHLQQALPAVQLLHLVLLVQVVNFAVMPRLLYLVEAVRFLLHLLDILWKAARCA